MSRDDLLRVARSVRPEAGEATVPVKLSWLPDSWQTSGSTVSGASASGWRAWLNAAAPVTAAAKAKGDGAGHTQQELSLVVDSVTDAPDGGDALTVAGHPARHPVRADEAGKSLTYLVVDLGEGRLMTLIGSGTTLNV